MGFIGVGMIGLPMAQSILKGGYPLTADDLDPERVALMVAAGARDARWQPVAGAAILGQAAREARSRC